MADPWGVKWIQKFASTGTFLEACSTAGRRVMGVQFIGDIASEFTGNMYVADTGNGRIQVRLRRCSSPMPARTEPLECAGALTPFPWMARLYYAW